MAWMSTEGGSSQDGPKWIINIVSCCPLRIGLWDPFQNRLFMVHTWGLILTTYQLTGMILQVGMMSRCSNGLIAGLNKGNPMVNKPLKNALTHRNASIKTHLSPPHLPSLPPHHLGLLSWLCSQQSHAANEAEDFIGITTTHHRSYQFPTAGTHQTCGFGGIFSKENWIKNMASWQIT